MLLAKAIVSGLVSGIATISGISINNAPTSTLGWVITGAGSIAAGLTGFSAVYFNLLPNTTAKGNSNEG